MFKACCILICVMFLMLSASTLAQNAPDVRVVFAQLNQSETTDRAAQRVLDIAGKDNSARQYVVQRLSQMIDKPQSDEVWSNAVRLAGQFKATETIPSLQKALSRGPLGGPLVYSMARDMRLDYDVVGKALSQIGDPAIPAANFLLSGDQKGRRRAVLILRNMGTPAARQALQDWLPRERDPHIKELIESGLK